MAKDTRHVLVIDLESTCWATKEEQGNKPNEIIEIGMAVVDIRNSKIVGTDSILVKPVYTEISEFCTKLTTITPEMAQDGVSLREAIAVIRQMHPNLKELTWASYGDYDRRQFERELCFKAIAYPFGPTHLNVKNLFALRHRCREVGMDKALEMLNIPLEGTHHRGIDDAKNIAKILLHLLGD